eukprot:IDg8329t1
MVCGTSAGVLRGQKRRMSIGANEGLAVQLSSVEDESFVDTLIMVVIRRSRRKTACPSLGSSNLESLAFDVLKSISEPHED